MSDLKQASEHWIDTDCEIMDTSMAHKESFMAGAKWAIQENKRMLRVKIYLTVGIVLFGWLLWEAFVSWIEIIYWLKYK